VKNSVTRERFFGQGGAENISFVLPQNIQASATIRKVKWE